MEMRYRGSKREGKALSKVRETREARKHYCFFTQPSDIECIVKGEEK